jgi:tetratricopeptide (TPR) repeat protein
VTFRLSRSEVVWMPIVLAALLVIYMPGLGNPPIYDDAFLTDGELFAQYGALKDLRPRWLSYGSFVWLQALLGEGWWKQRLFNFLLHVGVVLGLWALYREILRHIAPPAGDAAGEPGGYAASPALGFAIGFFALNPVSVYGVGYLIQRSIVMATLFVVLALWLFARGLATRRPLLHALAVGSYGLAVLAKEHALLAPLAAVPLYIVLARPSAKRLALIAIVGATLAGFAAYALSTRYGWILGRAFDEYSHVYLLQLQALRPGADHDAYSLSVINEAWLFFQYGLRWLLPFGEWLSINLRPPFPLTWSALPHVLGVAGYAATLAGGFFLVIRYRDWRALVGLSLLFPALLYPTEFATVWVQDPFVLYRSYLWAIGIPGLVFFLVHGPSPRVLAVIAVVVGTVLTWQSLDRVFSMSSPENAWTDAIAKLPEDPRAVGRWFPYLNRGSAYVDHNQFNLAMKDFEASSRLGDTGMGLFNQGALLAARGQHAQALTAFTLAEGQGYRLYNLPFQRGLSLLAQRRAPEAYASFEAARAMNPPSPTRELLLLNLGRTALQLNKPDEAVKALEPLVASDASQQEGKYLLGMAYIMKNDHARAQEVLDRLLREAPGGRAHFARALAHYGQKHKAEALADIENAIRLLGANPHLAEWREKIRALP